MTTVCNGLGNLERVCVTAGKLKPASAFMSGKLKLQGDMGKAMKLDKLMSKMGKGGGSGARAYHTITGSAAAGAGSGQGATGQPKSKL